MEHLSTDTHLLFQPEIIKLLNEAHILTVLDFLKSDNKQIEKISSLTLKDILEIKKHLLKKFSYSENAYDIYKRLLENCAIIPTYISRLDDLLEGGLYTGNIYEICGVPSSGKTIFCLSLLKNVIKYNTYIVYLDTKNDFSAIKLKQMMSQYNKEDIKATLDRIYVTKIRSKQDFLSALLQIKHLIQIGKNIKLIIIDSLPPLVFNSSNQTENNAFLNHSANILRYLTKEYNTTVIITNLITIWSTEDSNNTVIREKISCGSYWHGIPNVRISFKKNNNTCTITLMKSIKFIPENNFCDINFSNEGLI